MNANLENQLPDNLENQLPDNLDKTLNNKRKIYSRYFNIARWIIVGTSSFWSLLLFTIMILLIVSSAQSIANALSINTVAEDLSAIKISFIVYFTIALILSLLLVVVVIFTKEYFLANFSWQFIVLNLFILNIISFALYLTILKKNHQINSVGIPKVKRRWNQFLGIQKLQTIDVTIMSLFVGMTLLFEYISGLLPNLPNGGTVDIKYVPLMLLAFSHSFFCGWIVGALSALLSILTTPASYIISPWSFLLDYFLPMTAPSVVGLMPFDVKKDKNVISYANYFMHTFVVMIIIFFWQTLSGVLIWNVLFPDSIWKGYNSLTYSLSYNFFSVFILTYPATQAIIPVVYRTISPIYKDKILYNRLSSSAIE